MPSDAESQFHYLGLPRADGCGIYIQQVYFFENEVYKTQSLF